MKTDNLLYCTSELRLLCARMNTFLVLFLQALALSSSFVILPERKIDLCYNLRYNIQTSK